MKDLLEALVMARAAVAIAEAKLEASGAPQRNSHTLEHLDSLLAVAVRLAYDAQKEGTP